MAHLKVTLYIRITTPDGKRKMRKPVYASRGRLKPLYAADAKGNSLGHHPEGEYYLRYGGRTEAVGNDPYVALDRLEELARLLGLEGMEAIGRHYTLE